jgi:hypothetical protein
LESRHEPIILFYNHPFRGMPVSPLTGCACACTFTLDRERLREATAVVFHIPTWRGVVLPPKYPGQRWIAWSMESDANYPLLADPGFMWLFEITMTYQRRSTVWCPYFGPPTAVALLSPPQPKTEPAPAVYFQSSPFNRSGRIEYVKQLMQWLQVDSYGQVLQNRRLPEPDRGRETMLATMARYKFTLVFENSITADYVSDKFFDPLIAGSVLVYLGAPNIGEFAPADKCYINVSDFSGPAELAAYLNGLHRDDRAYNEYLTWKRQGLRQRFHAMVEPLHSDVLCRLCAFLHALAV